MVEVTSAATDSRWHTQTAVGGDDLLVDERGDCVRACMTSILGLPLDSAKNVHGTDWWQRWQEFVGCYGFELLIIYPKQMYALPSGYWMAVVPSLTMKANHCIVAKGRDLFHDPGMKRRYTTAEWDALWADNGIIYEGWLLVPLDPAEARRVAA